MTFDSLRKTFGSPRVAFAGFAFLISSFAFPVSNLHFRFSISASQGLAAHALLRHAATLHLMGHVKKANEE
jgi:hypothetical protein